MTGKNGTNADYLLELTDERKPYTYKKAIIFKNRVNNNSLSMQICYILQVRCMKM